MREFFIKLNQRKKEISLSSNLNWYFEKEDLHISATPSEFYNYDIKMGLYYMIESFEWNALFAEDRDEGLWIYLCYDLPDRIPKLLKNKIANWEETVYRQLEEQKLELIGNYEVSPSTEFPMILIAKYWYDIFNIRTIGEDPEKTIMDGIDSFFQLILNTENIRVPLPNT